MNRTDSRAGFRLLWLTGLLLLLPALAARAGESAIVDTPAVQAAHARGAILWDVRSEADYAKGHLPGAVNVGFIGEVLRDANTEDYLPTPQIAATLGAAGIDPSREVVVYAGRGNPFAYFGLVTLRHFGATRASVYHDGLDGWKAAGLPVSTEATTLPPVALTLKASDDALLDTGQLRALLGKVQLVDVRTPGEYHGRDIRALRGGHIPGAVNIPYEQNWADPETPRKLMARSVADNSGMALKNAGALQSLYGALDPDKETVVYCQSGVRASETATVLRSLGFRDVKVYDPSWLGYGNTLDAPAEEVAFFNVGLMNKRMKSLESTVHQLEAQLQSLQKSP